MFTRIGVAAFSALTVTLAAQAADYLKLTSPKDKQSFGTGSQCQVTGTLYLPERPLEEVESLLVRTRVFKAMDGKFVIVEEKVGRPGKPTEDNDVYAFDAVLRLPQEPGRYLLRVDCLDPKLGDYPNTLIGSQSVFVDLGSSIRRDTVKIHTPNKTDSFGTGSQINVGGTSTSVTVTKMRVRFVKAGKIEQENITDVVNPGLSGTWGTVLLPPGKDGWPKTDATIEAQGLKSNFDEVQGEFDSVAITVN